MLKKTLSQIIKLSRKVLPVPVTLAMLASSCATQQAVNQKNYQEIFKVRYASGYSSPAGKRLLNITYTVKDGEIVSCEDVYIQPLSAEERMDYNRMSDMVLKCDVENLALNLRAKRGDDSTFNLLPEGQTYDVPLKLVTEINSKEDLKGRFQNGRSWYEWEVVKE